MCTLHSATLPTPLHYCAGRQGISAEDLYYNILRTCCEGLSQAVNTDMGRYWVQFTYHRLPKLLVCLNSAITGGSGGWDAALEWVLLEKDTALPDY